jgi:hypothetical protein
VALICGKSSGCSPGVQVRSPLNWLAWDGHFLLKLPGRVRFWAVSGCIALPLGACPPGQVAKWIRRFSRPDGNLRARFGPGDFGAWGHRASADNFGAWSQRPVTVGRPWAIRLPRRPWPARVQVGHNPPWAAPCTHPAARGRAATAQLEARGARRCRLSLSEGGVAVATPPWRACMVDLARRGSWAGPGTEHSHVVVTFQRRSPLARFPPDPSHGGVSASAH